MFSTISSFCCCREAELLREYCADMPKVAAAHITAAAKYFIFFIFAVCYIVA